MTLERPMFPPVEQSNVVQFTAIANRPKRRPMLEQMTDCFPYKRGAELPENSTRREENVSVTLKNSRLRDQRYKVWRAADARQDYWHK
jgi:hypothetical protein